MSEEQLAYFCWESDDPERVAIWKLRDSELWLVTAREAQLLAAACDRALGGGTAMGERARELVREFCLAATSHDGFWSF